MLAGLEAMPVQTLFFQRPDHALYQAVLLRAVMKQVGNGAKISHV